MPFVQGEQVPQAQSFENIVGSSEFWSAQDKRNLAPFSFFPCDLCGDGVQRGDGFTSPCRSCVSDACGHARGRHPSCPSFGGVRPTCPVIDFAVSAPAVVPAALAPVVEFVSNVQGTQRIQFDSSLVFDGHGAFKEVGRRSGGQKLCQETDWLGGEDHSYVPTRHERERYDTQLFLFCAVLFPARCYSHTIAWRLRSGARWFLEAVMT